MQVIKRKVYAYITPADPLPPASTKWRVHIDAPDAHRVPLLDRPFGTRKSSVTVATYICTLSKVNGYWWYRVVSKVDGTATANRGYYFTPNRYVDGVKA